MDTTATDTDLTETWRPVVGHETFYEVSDRGRVRSLRRVVPHGKRTKTLQGRVLSPTAMAAGHLIVSLYCGIGNQGRSHQMVHRLVLAAFVGPCPEGHEACHRNGYPSDNRPENLYWGTCSDNVKDALRHGTHRWGSRTHCDQGHEFTESNTARRSDGKGRECRTCARVWRKRYKTKMKAQRVPG